MEARIISHTCNSWEKKLHVDACRTTFRAKREQFCFEWFCSPTAHATHSCMESGRIQSTEIVKQSFLFQLVCFAPCENDEQKNGIPESDVNWKFPASNTSGLCTIANEKINLPKTRMSRRTYRRWFCAMLSDGRFRFFFWGQVVHISWSWSFLLSYSTSTCFASSKMEAQISTCDHYMFGARNFWIRSNSGLPSFFLSFPHRAKHIKGKIKLCFTILLKNIRRAPRFNSVKRHSKTLPRILRMTLHVAELFPRIVYAVQLITRGLKVTGVYNSGNATTKCLSPVGQSHFGVVARTAR